MRILLPQSNAPARTSQVAVGFLFGAVSSNWQLPDATKRGLRRQLVYSGGISRNKKSHILVFENQWVVSCGSRRPIYSSLRRSIPDWILGDIRFYRSSGFSRCFGKLTKNYQYRPYREYKRLVGCTRKCIPYASTDSQRHSISPNYLREICISHPKSFLSLSWLWSSLVAHIIGIVIIEIELSSLRLLLWSLLLPSLMLQVLQPSSLLILLFLLLIPTIRNHHMQTDVPFIRRPTCRLH